MPHDDGRLTETCCGSNIGRREEDLLRTPTDKIIYVCHVQDAHGSTQSSIPQPIASPDDDPGTDIPHQHQWRRLII
jgi:hypothetical protein